MWEHPSQFYETPRSLNWQCIQLHKRHALRGYLPDAQPEKIARFRDTIPSHVHMLAMQIKFLIRSWFINLCLIQTFRIPKTLTVLKRLHCWLLPYLLPIILQSLSDCRIDNCTHSYGCRLVRSSCGIGWNQEITENCFIQKSLRGFTVANISSIISEWVWCVWHKIQD